MRKAWEFTLCLKLKEGYVDLTTYNSLEDGAEAWVDCKRDVDSHLPAGINKEDVTAVELWKDERDLDNADYNEGVAILVYDL